MAIKSQTTKLGRTRWTAESARAVLVEPCARLARRVRVATREQISEQKARRSRRRLDGWPLEVPIASPPRHPVEGNSREQRLDFSGRLPLRRANPISASACLQVTNAGPLRQ